MKIAFAFKFAAVTILGCFFGGLAGAAYAAEPIDRDYVRGLWIADHVVFVIEYWDGGDRVVDRQGGKSKTPFASLTPTEFAIDQARVIQLYGVEPCSGALVVEREGFDGRCGDYARMQLDILLKHPRVVFCRAFIGERGKTKQQATCFAHHYFPGSLDSVDMLEEQLVSIGALRLSRDDAGKALRPDLEEAEEIARKGAFGMWVPTRTKSP